MVINHLASLPIIILILWIMDLGGSSLLDLSSINTARQQKSAEIPKYMNLSADPCEDFYEFTCGNYADYYAVDKDDEEPETLAIRSMRLSMDAKLSETLSAEDAADDTPADKGVKAFYRSCIQAPNLLSLYYYKLKRLIGEFSKMPVLEGDNWKEDCFDWLETVATIIHKTASSVIFSVERTKSTEGEEFVLFRKPKFWLGEKSFGLRRFVSDNHEKYITPIVQDLTKFLRVDTDLAYQTAREIFEFEVALANYMVSNEQVPSLDTHYINDVQQLYLPAWDSKKLFSIVLTSNPKYEIVLSDDIYLRNAMNVVRRTSKRVVANYMIFIYLRHFMYGQNETSTYLAEKCLKMTKIYFPHNLDNLAYRKYLMEPMHEGVHLLWHELKTTFTEILQSSGFDWFHEEVPHVLVEKLKRMKLKIKSYEETDFAQEFAELHLKDYDYIQNIKKLLTLRSGQFRKRFGEKPQEDGIAITASYRKQENTVEISVALMQPLVYWSTFYPYAINFATMGSTLAHEILLGLDYKSTRELRERLQCFTNQSSLREWKIPNEIIADNGEAQLAYHAYLKWYGKAPTTTQMMEALPGLIYSNKQLFFISYGQNWCSVNHRDNFETFHARGPLTPAKLRVFEALTSFEEFAKEFNCPKGANMNSATKCKMY